MTHFPFRLRRLAAAAIVPVALAALTGLAPSAGASGTTGPLVRSQCGWYAGDPGLSGMVPMYAYGNMPSVAAVNLTAAVDAQFVSATFQFYSAWPHQALVRDGGAITALTVATDNAWQSNWSLAGTNRPITGVYIPAGFTDTARPDIFLWVTVTWSNGGHVIGSTGYWALNPRNVNNSYVCDGGGNWF